ncbi:hypothetical protein PG994_011039 [Apiospora phragmitis]|uniref:Inositol-pentakisphosphate 2-kinase n=1 Tax=Apiospora phragmitis TaxID=2905665 RepID=A0ABR1TUC5_9PEZI
MDTQSLWDALSGAYDDDDAGRKEAAAQRATTRLQEAERFVHVAEGRANAVFRACATDGGGDEGEGEDLLPGGLLRVPKKMAGAHPYDYARLQRFRATMIVPAVGARHLVPQLLVRVTAAQARAMNAARQASGHAKDDSTIEGPGAAMLIQDMTPAAHSQLGMEFKPKWLAQSPIAPPGAKRCRTCAREAYRNSQKLAQQRQKQQEQQEGEEDGQAQHEPKAVDAPVCPLGLLHDDPDVVLRAIARFAPPSWTPADHECLRRSLAASGLLTKLRDVQTAGDPGNTMFDNPEDPGFGLAMTLRDCTCFVRMPKDDNDDDNNEVEIKLADVDEKNWVSKREYWQKSHNNLVDSGFYHGTEEPHMETQCVLQM